MKRPRRVRPLSHGQHGPQINTKTAQIISCYLSDPCLSVFICGRYPFSAVCVDFFFPDGNGAFEFADGPFAGFERRLPMRRADGDYDASLADLEFAGAMDDADVRDVET